MVDDAQLMTVNEAAEFLRCSRSALDNMRKHHGLPYIKLGTRVLYKREALVNFINANEKVNDHGE